MYVSKQKCTVQLTCISRGTPNLYFLSEVRTYLQLSVLAYMVYLHELGTK